MTINRTARLVWTKRVGPSIFQQRFDEPAIARQARAGQFVHLLPGAGHLFRRAFSIYATDVKAGTFDVLHQVLGEGTRGLSRLEKGAEVDALGPLGNRFPTPPSGRRPILIGGGLGMAPLRLWALELATQKRKSRQRPLDTQPLMMLGARTRSLCTPPYGLNDIGLRPLWATDDGSRGHHGTVIALLSEKITAGVIDPAGSVVYGCGPERMMAALASTCEEHGIPCFVSLERSMPCGFGVCMGCVVQTRNGTGYETYSRVCRDGPVYDAADIIF